MIVRLRQFESKIASSILLFASMLTICSALQAQQKPEQLAQQSSDAWLVLVDSGKYADSWQEYQNFKAAVTKEQWITAMQGTRDPLGKMLSRKLKSATYTKSLPGVPDGEYVVIQYETSFENMKSAVETVTPMLDKDGKWRVTGYFIKRDTSELDRHRPQNPVRPYPYKEEEVSFENKAAGITLAATLTIPQGKGPFPAVLLITGSGPNDRDETLMGHKPFLVLADYLTRKGIVVLRADKRGIAKSTGNYAIATMVDFVADADAAVAYLKTRAEVDPHRIGLIGHSEGGTVAPMSAARNSDVAFIVMMAGPSVPGDEGLPEQKILLSEAAGQSHEAAEKNAAEEREILALVERENDNAALEKQLRAKWAAKLPEAQLEAQIKEITSPWFRQLIAYDPATALRKVTCPVLAINGEKDLQVSPKQNLPVIRRVLAEAGNKNYEVDELPGLNHLFQKAKTGAISEYDEIEETMSPVVLEKIASWILNLPHTSS